MFDNPFPFTSSESNQRLAKPSGELVQKIVLIRFGISHKLRTTMEFLDMAEDYRNPLLPPVDHASAFGTAIFNYRGDL